MPEQSPSERPCPFCEPAIFTHVFAEDAGFLAVYNIAPILPGHSLVVPRRHAQSLLELSDDELAFLAAFAQRMTRLLMRVFAADGFDWTVQDGSSAGQTVPHLHLHIIPRRTGDLADPGDWYQALLDARPYAMFQSGLIDDRHRQHLTPAEMRAIVARLKIEADHI